MYLTVEAVNILPKDIAGGWDGKWFDEKRAGSCKANKDGIFEEEGENVIKNVSKLFD